MSALGLPLYFNHVPKSAGTSLNELLSRSLGRSALGVEPFVPALTLYNLDSAGLDRLLLAGSHFPHWAAARRLPGWSTMTVVRRPWPRFLSLTRHLMRIEGSEPHALLAPQVRYLALLREGRHEEALRQAAEWYPFHASIAQCFLDAPPDGALGRLGPTALRVLQGYDLVLLSERLDSDWNALEAVFNGGALASPPRLNTSSEYGDAPEGPLAAALEPLFHALFPFEADVYEAAEVAWARSSAWLAGQARAGARVGVRPGRRPCTVLDWDGPVRCGGFSDRMVAASYGYGGRFARRVEASVGVVEIAIPRMARARLEGVFWISPVDDRAACRVTVNGTEVPMFDDRLEVGCPPDPSQLWAAAELPADVLSAGTLRIAFDRSAASAMREFWVLDLAVRPL